MESTHNKKEIDKRFCKNSLISRSETLKKEIKETIVTSNLKWNINLDWEILIIFEGRLTNCQ